MRSSFFLLEDVNATLTLRISGDSRRGVTYTSECSVAFADHTIRIVFDREGRIIQFFVNSCDLSEAASSLRNDQRAGLVPDLVSRRADRSTLDMLNELLLSEVRKYVHQNTRETTIRAIAWNLRIGSSDQMLGEMREARYGTTWWRRGASGWAISDADFERIRDLVLATNTPNLLSMCDEYVLLFVRNSYYVPPLRATAERYYRLQSLAVDEVDFQGKNLPMFLRSLTDTERKRFSEWTEGHFGFASFARASGGHVSLTLQEVGSDDEFNLADEGFGFSQMLPILTQLWVLGYRGGIELPYVRRGVYLPRQRPALITYAVEQPELHLHPRLQAKLADSFVDAIRAARDSKLDLRLVIETHSEAIVNRLGHRIANGDVDPEEINVVIFEKRGPDSPTELRFGQYDKDGFLTNWPFGFFEPEEIE